MDGGREYHPPPKKKTKKKKHRMPMMHHKDCKKLNKKEGPSEDSKNFT
jgi:hypothetical protein